MNQTKTVKTATPLTPAGSRVKYLVRRETHSSRAIISVIVALVAIIALVYLIVEAVLSMLGRKPLLMKPQAMVDHVVAMGSDYHRFIPASIIVVGVIVALVGVFLLLKATLPGELRRHSLSDPRIAVVVDDAVIAAGISRSVRRSLGLDTGQVTTSVQAKTITVNVTPTSGKPVADSDVIRHASALVGGWKLQPDPQVKASISDDGVVGR